MIMEKQRELGELCSRPVEDALPVRMAMTGKALRITVKLLAYMLVFWGLVLGLAIAL